jgi:hypothetical protein
MAREIVQALIHQAAWWLLGLMAVSFLLVWFVLGVISLVRARPEDIAKVVQALAKWWRW